MDNLLTENMIAKAMRQTVRHQLYYIDLYSLN